MVFNISNLLLYDVGVPEFFNVHSKIIPKKRFDFIMNDEDDEQGAMKKKQGVPLDDSFFVKHFNALGARKLQASRPLSPPPKKKIPPPAQPLTTMSPDAGSEAPVRPVSRARPRLSKPRWEKNEKELMINKKYDPNKPRIDISVFEPERDDSTVNSPRSHDALRLTGIEIYQLFYRPPETFKEPGLLETRAQLRFNHFEARRKDYLDQVIMKRAEIIKMEQKREEAAKIEKELSMFTVEDKGMNMDDLLNKELARMEIIKRRSMEQVENLVKREKQTAQMAEAAERKAEEERKLHEKRQREKIKIRKALEEEKIARQLVRAKEERREARKARQLAERLRKEAEERELRESEKREEIRKKAESLELARRKKKQRFEEMLQETTMIQDLQHQRRLDEIADKEAKRAARLAKDKEEAKNAKMAEQEEKRKHIEYALKQAAKKDKDRERAILEKQARVKKRQRERAREQAALLEENRQLAAEHQEERSAKLAEVRKAEAKRIHDLYKRNQAVILNQQKMKEQKELEAQILLEKKTLLAQDKAEFVERQHKIVNSVRGQLLSNIEAKIEKTERIIEKKKSFADKKRLFAQYARTDRDRVFGTRFYGLLQEMVVTKDYDSAVNKLQESSSFEKVAKKRAGKRSKTADSGKFEGEDGENGRPKSEGGNRPGKEEPIVEEPPPPEEVKPKREIIQQKKGTFNIGAALANFILGGAPVDT